MTLHDPDAEAVRRILAARPALRRVVRARDALRIGERELLHAGPRIARNSDACIPIAHSAIIAILFEGWTNDIDSARELFETGQVQLCPAQDRGCIVPLADVVSPSIWMQEVIDLGSSHGAAFSPINGGSSHVLRVGVLNDDVLAHLCWLNGAFARAFSATLPEPIPLVPIADEGLAGGDDCHGRTAVASDVFASQLDARWMGADASACRDFMHRAPSFFLNLWMAASKCMLDAARGIERSSVVIGAAGNGVDFGIRVASRPDAWIKVAAEPPAVAGGVLADDAAPLGAIGDSAVVDILGLGAMTTLAGSEGVRPSFADVLPDAIDAPRTLLSAANDAFTRTRPWMVVSARRIVETRRTPIVSLGVLDKAGIRGRLAGGFYRAPLDIFERALGGS
ncbi:MAG TPA: DUF1116 domain-containing protein [Casimicrobiaceae bacterium]|nr:DUF1116 domain-containing protein [Casimicrobiaceae bacterium]